jgi:thiosulfate/3-mercaptopyruvate sulfurtransferase
MPGWRVPYYGVSIGFGGVARRSVMHRSFLRVLVILLLLASSAQVASATPEASPASGQGWAHPEWFATVDWLQERVGEEGLALIALMPADDFEAGHIPGSAQVDWPELEVVETGDQSLAAWQDEVEGILTRLGGERGETVVVYDGGTFYSARLWWVLYQLGHNDVRILDGGLEAWTAEGGEIATGPSGVEPASAPYAAEPNEDAVAQIDEVEAALEEGSAVFVDARRLDEYAAGHIPGAVNVPFTDNAESDGPPHWKSPDELNALYESLGVTPDQRVIPYCTTGVRSAATYFTLRQLGYEDVALFTGSWVEWSGDPDRPVATGEQP